MRGAFKPIILNSVMPRKRKQQAHLDRLNAQKSRRPQTPNDFEQVDGPVMVPVLLSPVVADSDSEGSDNEVYWPVEDDWDAHPLGDAEKESLVLKWIPEAKPTGRKPHTGVSRWTTWRWQSEMSKRAVSMAGSKSLFELWNIEPKSAITETPNDPAPKNESRTNMLYKSLQILQTSFHIDAPNRQFERALKDTTKSDFVRLICVYRYIKAMEKNEPVIKSSEEIASCLYPEMNKERRGRNIRIWSEYFLKHNHLPEIYQGKNIKMKSIIADVNTQNICRQWLRSQRSNAISGKSFSVWMNENLHLLLGLPASIEISERTSTRWLHQLNYNIGDASKKGMYFDGHERPDVVEYRKKFLDEMEIFQKRMPIYEGESMEIRKDPELPGDVKTLIMVVHDESCFQSNDGGKTCWFDEDHRPIRPTSAGKSLMVSAFLCECHGILRLSDEQSSQHPGIEKDSTEIIKPGSNAEGYWTNADLVKQCKQKAMPIFKVLHPNCDAIFVFDNSANHHAFSPDALVASRLNLKDGGVNLKTIMRDGWFLTSGGERKSQPNRNEHGQQKGLRTILEERNLWRDGMKRTEAVNLLKSQPDYQEQREWLTETVVSESGFAIAFFPKFHCEFNHIEMFWGAAKRFARSRCNYSFNGLSRVLPLALSSVTVAQIRRFARKCFRLVIKDI